MEKLTERDKKFLEIITRLNKRKKQGTWGIFDCGKLGFVLITWETHGWESRWFTPNIEFRET